MADAATYIGIDLGGARGRTTAVARLEPAPDDAGRVSVHRVSTRNGDRTWTDEVLVAFIAGLEGRVVVAINAPLTAPACVRCTVAACPGEAACEDPAVVWLRREGSQLVASTLGARDRAAAVPSGRVEAAPTRARGSTARLVPYMHRATEVALHFGRGLIPRGSTGKSTGPVAARAAHLRRQLAGHGFQLNDNLIEVSARATVCALFDENHARGYKRNADPWETRAEIVESLGDLSFAPRSRLAREEVLRNDHCFEALLSAYTAFIASRDQFAGPPPELAEDGWIWVPRG